MSISDFKLVVFLHYAKRRVQQGIWLLLVLLLHQVSVSGFYDHLTTAQAAKQSQQ